MSEIEDTLMSIALGIGQTRKEGKENMEIENKQKRPRGFASMSPERRREIASKGGQAAQARGKAHQWTAEEASAAGKKGSARYAQRRAAGKLSSLFEYRDRTIPRLFVSMRNAENLSVDMSKKPIYDNQNIPTCKECCTWKSSNQKSQKLSLFARIGTESCLCSQLA